jgi:hypothetical protein
MLFGFFVAGAFVFFAIAIICISKIDL